MAELRIIEGVFGPFAGTLLELPADEADQAVADLWARERYAPDYPQVRNWTAAEIEGARQKAWSAAAVMWGATPPVLSSIDPATAEVGGANLVLTATGSGFDQTSRIVFNGGVEATEFVSDTSLTTTVKPSLASGPLTVPVLVRNSLGSIVVDSAAKDFSFTAPAGGE